MVNDHEAREKVDELLDEADELTRAERFEEALVKADAAAEIAAEAGIPPGSALCLSVLNARAICLGELGDPDGDQATLLRIFELSEGSVDPEVLLERRVAAANHAFISRQAGDTEQALSVLRAEILPWNPAPTDFGVEIYIRGARQAAHCLAAEGDNRAALELLEDVAQRYRDVTNPVARLNLAMVIATEADIYVDLDHVELAIAAYDRLLLGIGDLSDLALRLEAARALYARAYYKNVVGDADGAAKDHRDLLARFPPSEHEVLDRLRGWATDSLMA